MRKLAKRKVTEEYVFESDDGTLFPYEGQAIEHDIKLMEEELEHLNRGNINIPALNLTGSIYVINKKLDANLIRKYCELRDFELNDPTIPTKVIITDDFVISIDELKKVVNEIDKL